jgi:RNA polymerase sigma factor (sigma-70 family)
MSEAALTAEAPNTTGDAFDALYRECAADLFAYVRTVVRDQAAAEDVCALAFERAYARRGRFDPARGSRRAWLFAIARNAALDELRRRRRSAALLTDPPDDDAPGPEEEAETALRRATVRAALQSLSPADREIVALKFHSGLSNAELGRVLGTSATSAGSRLHRAVTKLREACHAPS